jgi:hypothetical protein
MPKEKKSFYQLSKERVFNNVELAEWLRQIEDKLGSK